MAGGTGYRRQRGEVRAKMERLRQLRGVVTAGTDQLLQRQRPFGQQRQLRAFEMHADAQAMRPLDIAIEQQLRAVSSRQRQQAGGQFTHESARPQWQTQLQHRLTPLDRPTDPLEATDLAALVASVVEEFEDMGEPVTFEESQRIALPLRATWLRRALRNLIGNALRYGEHATVSLLREHGDAVIRIEDEGPGIPGADLARMMEPFTRGESSRNRTTGGAGLGLAIARAIAEQHGGRLILTNRPEKGLRVDLRLPTKR